jgi:hypothetical protein
LPIGGVPACKVDRHLVSGGEGLPTVVRIDARRAIAIRVGDLNV